jgi:hypothetical protein
VQLAPHLETALTVLALEVQASDGLECRAQAWTVQPGAAWYERVELRGQITGR